MTQKGENTRKREQTNVTIIQLRYKLERLDQDGCRNFGGKCCPVCRNEEIECDDMEKNIKTANQNHTKNTT